MKKSPKKMAMGGAFMGNEAPLIRDTAFIEGRDYPVGGNESNNYLMPKRSAADMAASNASAEATMDAEMLRRGQNPRGIMLGGDSNVGNSGYQEAYAHRNLPEFSAAKKGGSIKAKKGSDWHGFGSNKTGKNNHGF